jgi:hypothetical protein
MFARWWRLDSDGRRDVWRLYGILTAVMCCGSCVGAAAWSVNILGSEQNFMFMKYVKTLGYPVYTPAELASTFAAAQSYDSAFDILYAVEFLFLSIAKLAVLDRLEVFAAPWVQSRDGRWARAGRVVMALVIIGSAVGICGNIVTAVYKMESAGSARAAAAAFAANNTDSFVEGLRIFQHSTERAQAATSAESIQEFSEMFVLLLIIFAFVVAGIQCVRRVGSALRTTARSVETAAGKHLRRRIIVTTVVVFITFLPRASYMAFSAVSGVLQDGGSTICFDVCSMDPTRCSRPYNSFFHMQMYLSFTPEIRILVVLVSSPLALLIVLWGMTSSRTLQAMKDSQLQGDSLRSGMLRGTV